MPRRTVALGLLLAAVLIPSIARGQDDRSRLEFWKANYNELSPADDPRAGRAADIFRRVVAAAGKRGGVVPSLFVVKDAGASVPLAIALPDGGIVISRQVLDICYKEPEKGDDRLAFILAHEIAHQLKDDFWHLRFFQAVELSQKAKPGDTAAIDEVRAIANRSQEPLLKEMQCDEYGIVYASMAGFDTRAIVLEDDSVNFFRYFAAALDPGNIKGGARDAEHPTPEARAAAVKARLVQVLDVVDLFDLGVVFYRTGDFETASRLFAEFLRYYPGREVYHDLAACHHEIALKSYREWKGPEQDYPFTLALTIESETRARKIVLRNGSKQDAEARFEENIGKAIELYRTALDQDASYAPSANNLGCALLLQENPYEAVAALQKASKSEPGSPLVLNNLGVAYFQAENPVKAKETLQEALKISPAYGPAVYNLGLISFREGDAAGAKKYGQSPQAAGAKAEVVRETLAGAGIGDYTDALPADWGPALRKKSLLGENAALVLAAYANGIMAVSKQDELVRLTVSPEFRGRTARGIAAGSTEKEITAQYGKPSGRCPSSAGETWIYAGQGIAFTLLDGKVVSWILFKPV